MSVGVSISRKPSPVIKRRISAAIFERSMILACRSGRRRSKKRYFKRSSSLVFVFSSIGKGGVSDSERMRSVLARTSSSPVGSFGFGSERRSRRPSTAMQYSLFKLCALWNTSSPQSSSSKISCRIPLRSRRSVNTTPPLLRLRCTQPMTVTSLPRVAPTTSPQRCVLFKPLIDSDILYLPSYASK